MDVRCERCRAQYVFDDEQVTPSGLTVQCTNCGHVFKVKKKELVVTVPVKPGEMDGEPMLATAAAPKSGAQLASAHEHEPEHPREWRVRQANGNVFTFRELTTLQKWIVEQKVSRDDEISLSGDQWKRLGNIAELASFFQVVEAAEKAKTSGAATGMTPLPLSMPVYGVAIQTPGMYPPPTYAMTPVPAPAPLPPPRAPSVDVDLGLALGTEEEPAGVKKEKRGRTAVLVTFLALSVGAAAYVLTPRLLSSKPPPESLAVPITIDVAPAGAGDAAPAQPSGSAPVAPEPVAEPPFPPPDVVAKPPAPAPPAPKGPKALLAQAARLREKGNAEGALDLYGRVADADPENAEALTGRGLCYLDLSSYGPAEASFKAALAANPDQPDALLGLAETYRWQGKKADAITNYEKYLERHPDGEEADVARNALEELRK